MPRYNRLVWSAMNGDIAAVQKLLDSSLSKCSCGITSCGPFSLDDIGLTGQTALLASSMQGHQEMVKVLIEAKADLDKTSTIGNLVGLEGATALHAATYKSLSDSSKFLGIAARLIAAKADIDKRREMKDGRLGGSPLVGAVQKQNEPAINLLLEARADVEGGVPSNELPRERTR